MRPKLPPERFAMVCFLALMQGGDGLLDKNIIYIEEKQGMAGDGYDAFAKLDIYNMRVVQAWHDIWGIMMPPQCAQYLADSEAAWAELLDRGVDEVLPSPSPLPPPPPPEKA